MKLFSEKVESTFTDSNINILGVRNFKEIFVDVFEFEINGKKFIAEKVSDHKGMPVVNIPVVFKGGEYTAPFALRRGVIEILFNEDNATFVKPVLEEVHELLEQHSENEKEEIYSYIKNTVEESANKLSSDIENKTKYVESLVNEKIINLTTNTIPNIFFKNMKGSDDSNLVEIKERLESIGTEIDDVKAEKESIYTNLKALAEETSHLSENVDKKINNTLSRVGSIKAALETSIESAVGDLNKKIEDVETNIERYYSEKITNVSNEVHELTEQNKEALIELIESSKQSILEEISLIKNNVPNIVIEKANGKQEIDLKGIKTELEKIIGTKFSTEIAALRRLIEMSSGGGSVAKQFANGGTMDGNLTVVGTISAQSYAGIPNPDLTQYLPISGGTVTGNLTVNGTLSTTLLEALSANITVIDIKQYELSGFNVTGNATVQGSVSATGIMYSPSFYTPYNGVNYRTQVTGGALKFLHPTNDSFAINITQAGNESLVFTNYNRFTLGLSYGDRTPHVQTHRDNAIGWSSTTTHANGDLMWWRDAAGVLAQRNGTATQTSRIYNTYTDASNYQRGIFTWLSGASAFVVGTQSSTTAGVSALSGLVNPIILAPGYNQSLSATAPVILQQTWNNSTNTFTLLSANVTDNASSASSMLMDLQVGGNSWFSVNKNGHFRLWPSATIYMFQADISTFAFSTAGFGGSPRIAIKGYSLQLASDSYIAFSNGGNANGTVDTILLRDAANTFAQKNGTNPQEFRLYGTSSGADREYAYIKSLSASSFTIGTSATGTGGNRALEFQTAGSTRMTIASSGNVGIGTTTPSEKLHISGDNQKIKITNESATNDNLLVTSRGIFASRSSDGGYAASIIAIQNSNQRWEINSREGSVIRYDTGERLRVDSTAVAVVNVNFGIGTTSPNQKLTVVGSISTIGTTDLATFQSTTTQTPNIKIIGTDRNVTLTPAANGGNGTGLTGPSFYNAVRDSSSNSVRFQAVNSNGTVTYFQLWDDNATGVLAQRSGAIPQESRIYGAYTDASNYERFFIKTNVGATSATQIGLSAAGTGQNRNLEFVTGGSTRMTIASSGRVGIGTITPSTNLEITTASNGDGIKLNRSDGERVAWVIDEGAGNGALYLFNGNNSNTGYITGNGSSFLNGGNLGIGTGTPNEKLTVVGNISASGNITSNTRYVVSISLSADITANNGTDTPLIFPLIKADPSGWTSVSGSSTRITPTVPGYYNVSYMLAWRPGTSGSGNQNNIQIVKNGATVSLAQQPIHVSADVNTTQVATALVYMNGTTDYLTFQAYSSNAAQVIIGDSSWSKVEFFKIN